MKRHHKWVALAGLTLGLCLSATAAVAQSQYTLINAAGETLQAQCVSKLTGWSHVANGATADFTCQHTLHIRATGSPSTIPQVAVSHSCAAGATQELTVTAVSSDTIEYSEACT